MVTMAMKRGSLSKGCQLSVALTISCGPILIIFGTAHAKIMLKLLPEFPSLYISVS
jgi:hypothetical protein